MSDYEYSDDDFVYSEEDENDNGGDGEGGSYSIDVENTFYEAEDVRRGEPARALELFNKVVTMEKEHKPDEYTWRFKSLEHIVGLHFRLGNANDMVSAYQELLSYLKHMTRNECNDTINNILDTISAGSVASQKVSPQRMYEITLEELKGKNDRLWFNTSLKLGNLHFDTGNFSALPGIIESLHRSLKSGSSKDDPNREAYLLQVYALELNMYQALDQKAKGKEIYLKTRSLSAAINDPRIMGGIFEAGGKMKMEEERWSDAYDELFEGFRNYQEAGNPRAKQCLKYVVLANMIALKDINPFDSREAKVYKDDKEIQSMMQLRSAFENSDVREFEKLLNDKRSGITDDPFIMGYVSSLLRNIRMQVLSKMVEPYNRVRISFLAEEINVSVDDVESILIQLILDDKINGKLDQRTSVLHLSPKDKSEPGTNSKYAALGAWASRLTSVINEY